MKSEIYQSVSPALTARLRFMMQKATDAFPTRIPSERGGLPLNVSEFTSLLRKPAKSNRRLRFACLSAKSNDFVVIVIVALIFICSEIPVFALSIAGSLMNTVWTRENQLRNNPLTPFGRGTEDTRTNLYFYEYAHLRATNIGSDRLSAYIRGRIGWKRFSVEDEKFTGRLYQGYINYRLSKKFDLRLGRQFLPNDVGFWQVDGARLGIKDLGPIDSRFYGGVAATPWMVEKKREGIAGIELSKLEVWRIQSRASFLTAFDKDGLNNVILGMQLNVPKVNIFDAHRDVHKRLSFFGRGSVNLLTQQVVSGYGYIHFSPLSPMHLSLEYQHETPLFPADSIFSIFAFEPLQQTAAVCEIDIFTHPYPSQEGRLGLYGRYARQFFDDDVPINQYSTGFSIKSRYERVFDIRLERLSDIHTKYWRIHSYIGKMLTPRLEIGLNHYYNNYELTRFKTADAYSYQLNVKYQIFRNLNAFIRIEDNKNVYYDYNMRVMGYINIRFDFTSTHP